MSLRKELESLKRKKDSLIDSIRNSGSRLAFKDSKFEEESKVFLDGLKNKYNERNMEVLEKKLDDDDLKLLIDYYEKYNEDLRNLSHSIAYDYKRSEWFKF